MLTRAILLSFGLMTSATLVCQSIGLDIKVFLEGPYQQDVQAMSTTLYDQGYLPGMEPRAFFATAVSDDDPYQSETLRSSNKVDIALYSDVSVDWIQVRLSNRNRNTVWQGTLLLESNGQINTAGSTELDLNESAYYITVHHRNHLPVISPLVTVSNGKLSFDFTSTEVPGAKRIADRYVLRGGHLPSDDSTEPMIDMSDIERWSSSMGKNSSYLAADIDMDGDVSVHDKSIILSNLEARSSIH